MQNAGQYVPGAANAHPTQQFVPSEPSPNGGTTTSSLRQFRKRDVDKSQLEQPPKQESHVARVAPHNHYPPVSNDLYRYQSHQFADYSPQVKYSDITDASQPNQISTSVIQKPKPKDYMEMCNVQQPPQAQPHISNQQPYSPDNGQYIHRDPMQGYPSGYKPEAHYLPKDQHQYQQLPHHAGQPKFNPMMTQTMRKYNPGPADNPFLNKLSKIHPSMARSIISDHHLQDPQPSYSPMDQRSIYGQQNHRYYSSALHQANLYAPNPNYPMNPTHHYPNYSSSCSFPRTPTIPVRYSHMERSMSPSRRGYPENVHMNLTYHNTPQKMPTAHNYSPQYGTGPEYAQHYQHRRLGQDCYPPQPCRPAQYLQNHHQLQAQEMQELPESRISPSDSLKKFIENWAADEEPAGEINSMETNMSLRDNVKVRDDAPPGTVYMINATDVQYFENNGIPIVTSDNGGIQLTSENYQYLLKNGLVDNSGMVRIIEANKEISIDSSGNHERIVNLQIMETSKPDCMMVNKSLRLNDGLIGMLPKIDDDNRRVVIHQNTIISPGNSIVSERVPSQQLQSKAPLSCADGASISISKELVDKNCSPINLDQLEHNIGFSELDQPETDNDINASSFVPECTQDSNDAGNSKEANIKSDEINGSAELSEKSEDSQNKSPGSKSMPIIIDLFADSHLEENDTSCVQKHEAQSDTDTITGNKKTDILATNDVDSDCPESKVEPPLKTESHCRDSIEEHTNEEETVCHEIVESENRKRALEDCSFILAKSNPNRHHIVGNVESTSLANSVIVSPDSMKKDAVLEDDTNSVPNFDSKHTDKQLGSSLKKNHEKEINISLESRNCNEPVLARSPVHLEVNVDAENKVQVIDQTNTLKEYPSASIERRKRIFSVDDIIHYIGNNIKKASTELDTFCSAEALSSFIEKEIEFSSLQQMAKVFHNKRTVRDDETLVVNNTNVEKRTNFNESVDSTNIPSFSNPVRMHKEIKDNKKTSIEVEENLEVKNEKIKLNIKSLNDDLVNDKQEIVGNQNLENATIEKEESTEDEQRSSDTSTVPIVLDERSNTPSAFQYRNAIRIDESSVLLQIAGELMEISVNIVNGKKVITVVPLSETTVVDYNDNYEVSGVVQEAVEMDDSGINSEETDIPNHQDECEQTKTIERADPENNAEDSFISTKEIAAVSCHEQEGIENKENSLSVEEKFFDQNQSSVNLKLDTVLREGGDHKIQEENTTNSSGETDTEPMLDILEDITPGSMELSDKSTSFEDDLKTKLTKLPPKFESILNTEIIQSYDILNSTTVSQVIEVNKSENIVIEESVKYFHNSVVAETNEALQFSELDTDSKTFPDPESLKDCILVETKEKTKDTDKTEDLNDNSQNRVNNVTSDDVQLSRKDQDHDDVLKKLSPKASTYEYIESEARVLEPEKDCLPVKPRDELYDKSQINNLIKEDDEDDLDTEHLDYQLEDDVFISEEPSHEIIVTDPLEGVGLIEEIDKTSDSFDIPLEPVTASDEFVETSQHDCEEKLEHSNIRDPAINDFYETSNGRSNSLAEDVTKKQENIKRTNEDTPDALPTDLEVTVTGANPYIPNKEETSIGKMEKNKELLVRHNKPEVQILSPTSTNIDDHVAISKENVYLGPIRRSNSDDETESTFVPITTKAAKKLYECDLQIPAVTTSGDISTKVNKKSIKHQHNNVSSSKKEGVVKDLSRSKKGTLKRSKRINEKNLIKNEQKEMLRLLAEKRKQRKEAKQEAMRQRGAIAEKNGLVEGSEKLEVIKKIQENKRKHSSENDDEYVDFKELLRARKLKKLKKMQEIRQKEVREIKNKMDETGKDKNVVDKSNNLVADGKEVNKSIIVSSSLVQENNGDKKIKCCIGCNNSVTKSNKDDKIKSKKRQSSSDDKNSDDSNTAKEKKCPTPTITNSASEPDHLKSTTSAAKIVLNIDSDKFSIKSGVPTEIKPKEILQTSPTPNVNIEEKVQTVVSNMEDAEREKHLSLKIKPQKRVSFCDDISSSTSNNEKFGFPSVDNTVPTKIRASSCANPKDPRRRSKSYSGQVMVPSVSELIEENNGGIFKKKISLADYVSRKRKTSTENHGTNKTEEIECLDKKTKFENSVHKKERSVQTASSYKSEEDNKIFKKTIKDVKTSFVIHSSDWEDSQSPIPTTVQPNEECLIQDFSGLIKSKSKKPVIDVNELNPVEILENPKDKKLQEYKDKVDSQLSSLNIQIPKIKSQNSENKRQNLNLDPSGSPESSSLIKKFLSNEKITQSEMEKIKKIISYKRLIQHQKNSRSPSKSPASTSSTYSQSSASSCYEPTGKAPCTSESAFSGSSSDPSCEGKNHITLESDSRDRRLHLKKVNAKRKLHLGYDDASSSSVNSNQSENINKKNVDYSVINRLGKDGLPKIIFKRNRQSNISDDNQLVVELERIDNNLELLEEKYNVTVTQMM